jgi:hypothetical protein
MATFGEWEYVSFLTCHFVTHEAILVIIRWCHIRQTCHHAINSYVS